MSYLKNHLYFKLANEIININKGNLRTKRKCITLNFLKTYHANIIENKPLLKFKFIFRSRIKRKRKRVIFFKRKYFSLKRFKNINLLKKGFLRGSLKKKFLRRNRFLKLNKNNIITKNIFYIYKKSK